MSMLTHREMEILEHLKTKTVRQTSEAMGATTSNIYSTLYYIRNKYEKCRQTVNTLDSLKGSNQRLAKILRRQETLTSD